MTAFFARWHKDFTSEINKTPGKHFQIHASHFEHRQKDEEENLWSEESYGLNRANFYLHKCSSLEDKIESIKRQRGFYDNESNLNRRIFLSQLAGDKINDRKE